MIEALKINNFHIKPQAEAKKRDCYHCTCPSCGTIFIFDEDDIDIPRMLNAKLKHCSITCPNCERVINMKDRRVDKEGILFEMIMEE